MKGERSRMRRLRFEALEGRLVLSVAPSLPAVHAASLHAITPVATESSNWSGYAVTGSSVTYVAGSWVVPTVSTTTSGYTSVWVGIDGFSSSTVEQIGTDSDYVNGRISYYAWYEMYPADSYNISMTVKPGDAMTASVAYQGNNSFLLTIIDTTETETFSKAFSMSGAARSSAEWIVEAPSSYSGVLALSNFGSVTFTNAYATIGTTTAAIDYWQSYSINLVTGSTVQGSTDRCPIPRRPSPCPPALRPRIRARCRNSRSPMRRSAAARGLPRIITAGAGLRVRAQALIRARVPAGVGAGGDEPPLSHLTLSRRERGPVGDQQIELLQQPGEDFRVGIGPQRRAAALEVHQLGPHHRPRSAASVSPGPFTRQPITAMVTSCSAA